MRANASGRWRRCQSSLHRPKIGFGASPEIANRRSTPIRRAISAASARVRLSNQAIAGPVGCPAASTAACCSPARAASARRWPLVLHQVSGVPALRSWRSIALDSRRAYGSELFGHERGAFTGATGRMRAMPNDAHHRSGARDLLDQSRPGSADCCGYVSGVPVLSDRCHPGHDPAAACAAGRHPAAAVRRWLMVGPATCASSATGRNAPWRSQIGPVDLSAGASRGGYGVIRWPVRTAFTGSNSRHSRRWTAWCRAP